MEMETQEKRRFLDVLAYQRTDGSVGHMVYRKPIHTNLYWNTSSCHHLAQKRSVLATVVYWAVAISGSDSLQDELCHLHRVFLKNGYYNPCKIQQAINGITTDKQQMTPAEERKLVMLPFCSAMSFKIAKPASKFGLKHMYWPVS